MMTNWLVWRMYVCPCVGAGYRYLIPLRYRPKQPSGIESVPVQRDLQCVSLYLDLDEEKKTMVQLAATQSLRCYWHDEYRMK